MSVMIKTFAIIYQISILSSSNVSSFGFSIINDNNATLNDGNTFIKLYWESIAYQCNITVSSIQTSYSCNIMLNTTISQCDNTGYVHSSYSMSITNGNDFNLSIDAIFVNFDNSNTNNILIESFCLKPLDEYIGINTTTTTNCIDSIRFDIISIPPLSSIDIDISSVTTAININYKIDFNNVISQFFICPTLKISSFGFITHGFDNSGPDGSFNFTLYWGSQIIICQFINPPNEFNAEYRCNDTSNIIIILNQQQPYQYKFKIDYNIDTVFRIDTLFVEDLYGNRYQMLSFCGAEQFYYWYGGSSYNTTKEILCDSPFIDNNNNDKFNFPVIKMDRITTKLTNLYISFIDDILSYPNHNIPGIISPEQIKSFGLKTSNRTQSSSVQTVDIKLYWDFYIYSCSIIPNMTNTEYICSNPSYIKTNCINYMFQIENDGTDALFIDYIFINDKSDLQIEYKIDTFCSNTSFDYTNFAVNPFNGKCNGYSFDKGNLNGLDMIQFTEFCIDTNSCGHSKFAVDFSKELMINIDSFQSGFVYPINSLHDICYNTSVITIYPTVNPTQSPYSVSTTIQSTKVTVSTKSSTQSTQSTQPTQSMQSMLSSTTSVTGSSTAPRITTTKAFVSTTKDEFDKETAGNKGTDFTWLFIVISLTVIVALVCILILCWFEIKKLKNKQHVTAENNIEENNMPNGIVALRTMDSKTSFDINTKIIISENEEGDGIYYHRDTNDGHRNTNTAREGAENETNFEMNTNDGNKLEMVIQAQEDEEVIGDDDVMTPKGSITSAEETINANHS